MNDEIKHTPCDCAEWRRLNEACADLLAERDRLLTLATKWCNQSHHDWQEIKQIAARQETTNA